MEKKDNNEDEGRVKRKEGYPHGGERGRGKDGRRREGEKRGRRRMKVRKKKEEDAERGRGRGSEEESEAGNLDRVDRPLEPRAPVETDLSFSPPRPCPCSFAKIWILFDLSRP